MEKTDKILFGKHKGSSWQELLDSGVGTIWGDWWSATHSTGKFANKENKEKNTWRKWRELKPIDTRKIHIGSDFAEINEKLDTIIGLLTRSHTVIDEWQHE